MEHPIHSLMKVSMENIKEMIDVDTIVGEPVATGNGSTIIPISKVKFGFAAGGTEQMSKQKSDNGNAGKPPFGGGSGGTVGITPIAFLVIKENEEIKVLHLEHETHIYEKLIDFVPELMEKFNFTNNKRFKTKSSKELKMEEM
ncbi:GerW family sporulation protein [Haloplasma contractile]|uniref:Sporulation protein YtfJ n=1 Tax=Haloplasma contractile SSD-17B TaxID=1033810 RepID=F7PWI0_9MOLU|nr:GerW family sporulation protein [Haloplasma contractile]ERJ10982.1 Sporulation protein YtfJ [Haloplasma contractile SSD-17B]